MNLVDRVILRLIKVYQTVNLSIPRGILERGCRFSPTCSTYTYNAVERYGTIKGLILGVRRVVCCHPFSKGGYDPLK
ncbi:membrane protein insertion efficiency factor YidD [Candidatus Gottesmanbacteria bacterium RIFCSPHIGHO2_02_FULL_39_14]|uniref:Putative membrane protein insertion efficiency factor n=3 Tax=Candidatus Gottesmaniibacteriota TaxID=1752720 RepID=A0A1F5ZYY1_9BACT|nr:MAG: membrane protein insertion efficiency factor YidD [Candidatus Gottesmanbacteria bacterium RBG_16_38_7b]OGG17554.1 MAG: membrane protein insertion efficiency factor YidD [Candidatus Gottesmanbacteria bacterium RIFCSPHIGHO2_02_FULL_39_14]OGG32699.1 MAG: membrane protein insertion efficiency factor YidD [Candidatus Gottesmanbacteria bacterium RIFCSPLOWO2_02_FULL_38_8]